MDNTIIIVLTNTTNSIILGSEQIVKFVTKTTNTIYNIKKITK